MNLTNKYYQAVREQRKIGYLQKQIMVGTLVLACIIAAIRWYNSS